MLAPTLTHLNISSSNFTGPIPSEIAHLSKLVVLHLYGYKDIPSLFRLEQHDFRNIISNLTQLEILVLSYINMSSSNIPDSIVNLTSLTSLTLVENGLYGQVPDAVFNLPALQILFIRSNDGTILPDSIGHLRSLNLLDFDYCNISGSLPSSIGNLSQLFALSLSYNNFSGLIPHSLSNLYGLTDLYLLGNQFEGQIPSNITGLRNLIYLDLSNNFLQGSIPAGLFGLPNLVAIWLDNNMLSGALPSILPNSMLSSISIPRNNLSGPIPHTISNLKELHEIDLSFNNFDGKLYLDTFSC
ncbi:receptor-like protein 53 [Impatiens glandulifera]|uniref:receptor-like protein 53 n=1 Tax=Impatiens glandulifera TaxID=253017 RepID=UPI001FB18178|nr:receptor-like protein 53 [Impatiens glandulifera]